MRPISLLSYTFALALACLSYTAQCQTTSPPGTNTPLIQPSSLSIGEDKSYLTSTVGETYQALKYLADLVNRGALLQRYREPASDYKLELPKSLFSFSSRLKSDRKTSSFTPEIVYSDTLLGVDVGVQDVTVFSHNQVFSGPGISLRADLSPSRITWTKAYRTYRRKLKESIQNPPQASYLEYQDIKALDLQQKNNLVSSFFNEGSVKEERAEFLERFIASGTKLRLSTVFAEQWLASNEFLTGGISLSQVFPTRCYKSTTERIWGIVPRVAAQALLQTLSNSQVMALKLPRYSSAVRTSLGLSLQNNIPHITALDQNAVDVQSVDVTNLGRWTFQLGGEYVFRNVVDGDESYGIYSRFRSLKSHTETTLSLSRTPSQDYQFGLGFSFTFE